MSSSVVPTFLGSPDEWSALAERLRTPLPEEIGAPTVPEEIGAATAPRYVPAPHVVVRIRVKKMRVMRTELSMGRTLGAPLFTRLRERVYSLVCQ
jgi:hypothetical protein